MIVVGITGGIGSGKTTVVGFFEELGVPVFIADVEAKRVMNSSLEVKNKIIDCFGEKAYHEGKLNRAYLAQKVFKDSALLQQLNAIVHPAVGKAFEEWRKKQNHFMVLYEAAILFENNRQKDCDYTILITAPKEVRIQRIQKRDGSTVAEIEERMNQQWSDEKKIKLADFVIKNEDLIKTKQIVHQIYKYLKDTHKF